MQSDLVGDIYFMTGIYAIINPNNEYYIGKSTNIKRRFGYYRSIPKGMPPKLKNSFEKFGFENHQKIILKECSVEDMPKWEKYYQIKYDAIYNGLNVVLASNSDQNGKQSEERVRKRAESNRGKKRSEETKALMSKRHMEKGISKNVKPPKIIIAEHKISGEKIEKSMTQMAKHFKCKFTAIHRRVNDLMKNKSQRKDLDEWKFYFKNPT